MYVAHTISSEANVCKKYEDVLYAWDTVSNIWLWIIHLCKEEWPTWSEWWFLSPKYNTSLKKKNGDTHLTDSMSVTIHQNP